MIVIVTGGRDNHNENLICSVLQIYDGCTFYVGDCPTGVDKIVIDWARSTGNHGIMFKADWARFGRSAGPRRNTMMITRAVNSGDAVICIAFDGGAGTAHCIKTAQQHKIPVLRVQGRTKAAQ